MVRSLVVAKIRFCYLLASTAFLYLLSCIPIGPIIPQYNIDRGQQYICSENLNQRCCDLIRKEQKCTTVHSSSLTIKQITPAMFSFPRWTSTSLPRSPGNSHSDSQFHAGDLMSQTWYVSENRARVDAYWISMGSPLKLICCLTRKIKDEIVVSNSASTWWLLTHVFV